MQLLTFKSRTMFWSTMPGILKGLSGYSWCIIFMQRWCCQSVFYNCWRVTIHQICVSPGVEEFYWCDNRNKVVRWPSFHTTHCTFWLSILMVLNYSGVVATLLQINYIAFFPGVPALFSSHAKWTNKPGGPVNEAIHLCVHLPQSQPTKSCPCVRAEVSNSRVKEHIWNSSHHHYDQGISGIELHGNGVI